MLYYWKILRVSQACAAPLGDVTGSGDPGSVLSLFSEQQLIHGSKGVSI